MKRQTPAVNPQCATEGLTVGATTSTNAQASYSNCSSYLDLFAPSSSITLARYTSDTTTNTISRTSIAPDVAALHLQGQPGAMVSEVNNAIVNNTTAGVVGNPGRNSPNLLLYSLAIGSDQDETSPYLAPGRPFHCAVLFCDCAVYCPNAGYRQDNNSSVRRMRSALLDNPVEMSYSMFRSESS